MKYIWIGALLGWMNMCSKNNVSLERTEQIPNCIEKKIKELQQNPVQNPPATLWQYEYKEQVVYGLSADCCDQFNLVFDSNCNVICSPSGGFTGKGDGRCLDFEKEAKNAKLIWQDDRK